MDDILISICLLCSDEDSKVYKVIEDSKKFSGEIVIVYTGEDRKFINSIKELGCNVYREKFDLDFSKVKNVALDKAKGKWILFLDVNEEVTSLNKEKIFNYIKNNEEDKGISLRIVSLIEEKRRGINNEIRLFRNDKKIRFNGKINESVLESINSNYGEEKISLSDVEILHYGNYGVALEMEKRRNINFSILNSYSEDKKDSMYYFNLGNEYGKINNFKEALKNYDKALELDLNKEFMTKYILNKSKTLYHLNMYDKLEKFLNNHINVYKDFKDLYFIECLMRIQLCEFKKAEEALDKFINTKYSLKYPSSEFHEVIDIDKLKEKLSNIENILY